MGVFQGRKVFANAHVTTSVAKRQADFLGPDRRRSLSACSSVYFVFDHCNGLGSPTAKINKAN